MKKQIKLTESELQQMIYEAVEEGWWGRNFGGQNRRINTQVQDAINAIKQSDQLIEQFKQQAQSTQAQPQQQAVNEAIKKAIKKYIK